MFWVQSYLENHELIHVKALGLFKRQKKNIQI